MKAMAFVASAAVAASTSQLCAQGWFDPPGKPFMLYTLNSNDGYSASRGVLFNVSEPLVADTYWWTNNMPAEVFLTWELREDGVTVDTAVSETGGGGFTDYFAVGGGYTLMPGHDYELSISHNANAVANYFYDYDPFFFGDPPFAVGVITVFDGTQGHDASNFVMPRMGINVPAPGAGALMGLGLLVASRRRR